MGRQIEHRAGQDAQDQGRGGPTAMVVAVSTDGSRDARSVAVGSGMKNISTITRT